jgi:DNA polymerase iota
MADAASDSRSATGRDIVRMFERQEDVLKQWKVEDRDVPPEIPSHDTGQETFQDRTRTVNGRQQGSEDLLHSSQHNHPSIARDDWDSEDEGLDSSQCSICGAVMPPFAMTAHQRFHSLGD